MSPESDNLLTRAVTGLLTSHQEMANRLESSGKKTQQALSEMQQAVDSMQQALVSMQQAVSIGLTEVESANRESQAALEDH